MSLAAVHVSVGEFDRFALFIPTAPAAGIESTAPPDFAMGAGRTSVIGAWSTTCRSRRRRESRRQLDEGF